MNVSESYNLKVLYPEVAEEWHPSKNGALTPDQITPHTSKKMWWRCRDDHEWHATVGSRTRGGSGCPYCYGRYITDDYNLQVINPGVSKQWHPVKNGSLTAAHMAPNTIKIVWWLCEKGHEWQSRVCDRNRGTRCPYCAAEKARRPGRGATSLLEARPDLAEQWHPTKNDDLTPDKVSYGSKRKVWWLCSEEGHEWLAAPKKRNAGTACPYCSGYYPSPENNLAVVDPELAKQWHPHKNEQKKPHMFTPGSKQKVWWKCEHGHEWQIGILNRRHGSGCPYCSGKKASKEYNFAVKNPEIALQWHPVKNGKLTPDKVTPWSNKKTWWMCDHGHEWLTKVGNRSRGRGCPICYKERLNKKKTGTN